MQFVQAEAKDGCRFSWNVFPTTRLESTRMAVPLACMYTPLKSIDNLAVVNYAPVQCKSTTCNGILNPYCKVDFMNKIWICPFCMTRNHFPHHYNDISSEHRPAEIIPQFTTMEYMLAPPVSQQNQQHFGQQLPPSVPLQPTGPCFLFVVDTCIIEEELTQVKSSILQSLQLLPETSSVGLITFGKNVQVHELAFDDCPKSYVFRGDKELSQQQVANLLQLKQAAQTAQQSNTQQNAQQSMMQQGSVQSSVQ